MTPEAQRIAIAEACGWHSFRDIGGDSETKLWGHPKQLKETSLPTELVPDYLRDLNAMHEAEKVLGYEQRLAYVDNLVRVSRFDLDYESWDFGVHRTESAHKAKAFLLTLCKWEDSK